MYLTNLEGENTLSVYNLLGEKINSTTTFESTYRLDLTGQAAGNYYVRIVNSGGQATTVKFILQN